MYLSTVDNTQGKDKVVSGEKDKNTVETGPASGEDRNDEIIKETKLAFTATEFALCELNGWYDWNKSGGSGQNCAILPERHMHDLAGLFANNAAVGLGLGQVAMNALNPMAGAVSIFNLLAIIALGYCVIKIFFANIKRGGILLTQIAVGSLYLFSLPKGYTDGFTQWCKQVIALCLTAFMQMTLLYLGLLTWQTNMLLGLGVMLSANEVPRIAQMFGLDTSVRVNMMSAVHTTTTAINLTRALAKK